MASAARRARNRFHGYVELEDMLQEAWMAVYAYANQANKAVKEGDEKALYRLVYKYCMLYGHREKATKVGYRVEDLFFYGKRLLRDMIPVVLEGWNSGDSFEFEYSDRALLLDIKYALELLSEAEYQIVWWAFFGDPEEDAGYENVAGHLGITADAARQRVNRILRRMQESLGGENPAPSRKAKSNAAAIAETHNAWDGEG